MARSCSGVSAKKSRQPVIKTEFILSACVELELGAIWARIATDNPDEATRFIELARETFVALARAPASGRLWKFRNSRLQDVRSRHISGLDNYLVFYRPVPGGIKVLHVYHGARDIEMLKPARPYRVLAEMHQTPARPVAATLGNRSARWIRYCARAAAMLSAAIRRSGLCSSASAISRCS